jgi:Flp pilus assembly protein CpaB
LLWWVAVLGSALAAGLVVSGAVESARAEATRFGAPVPLVVARRDLAPGTILRAGDVEVTERPAGVVPAGAIDRPPLGAVVTQTVLAGEALVAVRLDRDGPMAEGTRALALPTGPGRLDLRPGDRVDVLATFDPLITPRGEDPTVTVAHAATVVGVGGRAVTVAVTEAEAPRVAFALSQATITLARTPPGTVPADDP